MPESKKEVNIETKSEKLALVLMYAFIVFMLYGVVAGTRYRYNNLQLTETQLWFHTKDILMWR